MHDVGTRQFSSEEKRHQMLKRSMHPRMERWHIGSKAYNPAALAHRRKIMLDVTNKGHHNLP
jgi:hypothetical protein